MAKQILYNMGPLKIENSSAFGLWWDEVGWGTQIKLSTCLHVFMQLQWLPERDARSHSADTWALQDHSRLPQRGISETSCQLVSGHHMTLNNEGLAHEI